MTERAETLMAARMTKLAFSKPRKKLVGHHFNSSVITGKSGQVRFITRPNFEVQDHDSDSESPSHHEGQAKKTFESQHNEGAQMSSYCEYRNNQGSIPSRDGVALHQPEIGCMSASDGDHHTVVHHARYPSYGSTLVLRGSPHIRAAFNGSELRLRRGYRYGALG